MDTILPYFSILVFALLIQCSPENQEDLYYEPLVEGIFNVSVDQGQALDFTIEPNKDLTISGQFQNGIPFTIEFDAGALKFNEPVEASIMPLSGILDMPDDFQFEFGFVFSPEGVLFNSPGKMTVELPANVDISEFKGFFFEGGVPYGIEDPEIWSVKLTPVLFRSESGKKKAVFEIPHFSGFLGISGGDFKCGNPLAADVCEDLKEILACYVAGKESISSEDRNKVNNALRVWMEAGLAWLEENPSEFDDYMEVEMAMEEVLCWKAAALMFNSTMAPFDDLRARVADLFTGALINKLVILNQECLNMDAMYEQAYSFGLNSAYMDLLEDLLNSGFLNQDPGINHFDYCDSIALKMFHSPFLDTTETHIRHDYGVSYSINFGEEARPAVARSKRFTVYATNLLGEAHEMIFEEDYTIENVNASWFTVEGNTITEQLITCEANGVVYPCYPTSAGIQFTIMLKNSNDGINVRAGRHLWQE